MTTEKIYSRVCIVIVVLIGLSGCREEMTPVTNGSKKVDDLKSSVLNYFIQKEDSLQLKAAEFIIKNIDIHYSQNFFFSDSIGKRLHFNELDYGNFDSSLHAFEMLKEQYETIQTHKTNYSDSDTLDAAYLIKYIEEAFQMWQYPWNEHLNFEQFCEFVLPYRISSEPVQNWRMNYKENNAWVLQHKNSPLKGLYTHFHDSIRKAFINTNVLDTRQEPMPLLGPLNLQHRKQGDCSDYVNYTAYNFRSVGMPACVDFVSYWGTASGRHFWNVFVTPKGDEIIIDRRQAYLLKDYWPREVPKVFRISYASQPECIANKTDESSIPNELLKMKNLKDVTDKYVETTDVVLKLKNVMPGDAVYLCVLNYLNWKPVCGEIVSNDGTIHFENMGRGIIYLPQKYNDGKFVPAGNPFSIHHDGQSREYSVNGETVSFNMLQEEGYLIYRPGKRYKLRYWDDRWITLDDRTYDNGFRLHFTSVPSNTVYLLIPEYSWGKERPFTIDENGGRIWW